MGLNWHSIKFLSDMRRRGVTFSRVVTIGRLNLFCPMTEIRQIFDQYHLDHPIDDTLALSNDQYAESIFKMLGATSVDSIDASTYEGATIVCDLNSPVSPDLHKKFDLVYDGGTIEHVFNAPAALKNLMSMAKVGGDVVIHTMANNCFGHGFYQFSPELFYRAFSPENGYRLQRLVIHAVYEFAEWYDVPDPAEVRGRIELANGWDGIMMLVHARRERECPIFERFPQQSDYLSIWDEKTSQNVADANASSSNRHMRDRLVQKAKQVLPWAVHAKHRLMWAFPVLPRLINRRKHRQEKQQRFSVQSQPNKFRRDP